MFLLRTFGIIILSCIAVFSFAQEKDSLRYHANSYRLDLPPDWNKPKLIKLVTDILPETLVELKDRSFCTSGKADYTIRLLIDSMVIYDQQSTLPQERGSGPETYFIYHFSFTYRFYAALVLFDDQQKPISRLILLTPAELFDYSKQFTTRPNNGVYEYEDVYNRNGKKTGTRIVEKVKPYITELPKHHTAVVPYPTILAICKAKMSGIWKLLQGSVVTH